jgi:hypothetical protein
MHPCDECKALTSTRLYPGVRTLNNTRISQYREDRRKIGTGLIQNTTRKTNHARGHLRDELCTNGVGRTHVVGDTFGAPTRYIEKKKQPLSVMNRNAGICLSMLYGFTK